MFSAGALNFGGTVMLWSNVGAILDNVWGAHAHSLTLDRRGRFRTLTACNRWVSLAGCRAISRGEP